MSVTKASGTDGGGLVPWALIAGYGGPGQVGFTASYEKTLDFS